MLFSSLPLSLYSFSYFTYSFTHTHIRWDKDKQETSDRTEIGLCDRLSQSQWGTSYSFTVGSDTDDQFNELVSLSCSLQPFPRKKCEMDLCYKQQYLNVALQWHIPINTIKSIWPEDRMECCHTSMDCGQEKNIIQLLTAFPQEIFSDITDY